MCRGGKQAGEGEDGPFPHLTPQCSTSYSPKTKLKKEHTSGQGDPKERRGITDETLPWVGIQGPMSGV